MSYGSLPLAQRWRLDYILQKKRSLPFWPSSMAVTASALLEATNRLLASVGINDQPFFSVEEIAENASSLIVAAFEALFQTRIAGISRRPASQADYVRNAQLTVDSLRAMLPASVAIPPGIDGKAIADGDLPAIAYLVALLNDVWRVVHATAAVVAGIDEIDGTYARSRMQPSEAARSKALGGRYTVGDNPLREPRREGDPRVDGDRGNGSGGDVDGVFDGAASTTDAAPAADPPVVSSASLAGITADSQLINLDSRGATRPPPVVTQREPSPLATRVRPSPVSSHGVRTSPVPRQSFAAATRVRPSPMHNATPVQTRYSPVRRPPPLVQQAAAAPAGVQRMATPTNGSNVAEDGLHQRAPMNGSSAGTESMTTITSPTLIPAIAVDAAPMTQAGDPAKHAQSVSLRAEVGGDDLRSTVKAVDKTAASSFFWTVDAPSAIMVEQPAAPVPDRPRVDADGAQSVQLSNGASLAALYAAARSRATSAAVTLGHLRNQRQRDDVASLTHKGRNSISHVDVPEADQQPLMPSQMTRPPRNVALRRSRSRESAALAASHSRGSHVSSAASTAGSYHQRRATSADALRARSDFTKVPLPRRQGPRQSSDAEAARETRLRPENRTANAGMLSAAEAAAAVLKRGQQRDLNDALASDGDSAGGSGGPLRDELDAAGSAALARALLAQRNLMARLRGLRLSREDRAHVSHRGSLVLSLVRRNLTAFGFVVNVMNCYSSQTTPLSVRRSR